MDESEHYFNNQRNIYRKRRNIIRTLFLTLFIFIYIFIGYKIFLIPQNNNPKVEVVNNLLINPEFITGEVLSYAKNNNLFFLSLRNVSEKLLDSVLLLKDIVIRKYFIPEFKFVIFVNEKKLWAILNINDKFFKNQFKYVTSEGDLVSGEYLDMSKLPKDLIHIESTNQNKNVEKDKLIFLKNLYDLINEQVNIDIKTIFITHDNELEILAEDGIRIKFGRINDGLVTKVGKLNIALKIIKEKSYLVDYVDLTLEQSVIFKKMKTKIK